MENLDFIEVIRNFILFVIVSACLNSCVVAGFLKSIKRLRDVKDNGNITLPNYVGVACTYIFAFFFIILLGVSANMKLSIISIPILGFITGCVSILVYESAIKTLIDLIPDIYNKFLKK